MPVESAFTPAQRGQMQFRQRIAEIGVLANRQHGVVSRMQLRELGMGSNTIDRQLDLGRLHRLHPGVYSVGHRLVSREGRWMAAALAGGEGAVLSHRSAAALWGLQRASWGEIEITTPRSSRSRGQIRRHCAELALDEWSVRRRIPVTTVSRTLFDLAAVVPPEALAYAMREAEFLRLPLRPSLEEMLARHPRRRGAKAVRTCLRRLEQLPPGRTRSGLERRFLAFIAQFDLPRPQINVLFDLGRRQIEADCLWREPRLIVELDGHEAHGTRAAFESDRERDRCLQTAGWRVVRITWLQLRDERQALARDLRALLVPEAKESPSRDTASKELPPPEIGSSNDLECVRDSVQT